MTAENRVRENRGFLGVTGNGRNDQLLRNLWLQYGLPVLFIVVSTAICKWVAVFFPVPAIYLGAVVFAALVGGWAPSLVAMTLSAACIYLFFIPYSTAQNALHLPGLQIPRAVVSFAVSAVIVTVLSAAQRRAGRALRKSNSTLDAKVRELECTNRALADEIVERKRTQEMLQSARVELWRLNRVLLLGEITASIAHEVNQPIAAVVANANAGLRWLDGSPPNHEEVRQAFQRIVRDGNRAGDVIKRVRSGLQKHTSQSEPVAIADLIRDVVELVGVELRSAGVQFHPEFEADLPRVDTDPVEIRQVLLNLILNAIEALSDFPGEAVATITISAHRANSGVAVEVRDNGPGFVSDDSNRLFDSFYTTKRNGTGMGLAICRSIVESHGGRISAEANEPCGAMFRFTLPAVRNEPVQRET